MDDLPADWYTNGPPPDQVGTQGKKKNKERMEKKAKEMRDGDEQDEDDWFANKGGSRGPTLKKAKGNDHQANRKGAPNGSSGSGGGGSSKKITISIKGAALGANGSRPPPSLPSKPALLDRLSESRLAERDYPRGPAPHRRKEERERDYGGRDRDRDRDRGRDDRGYAPERGRRDASSGRSRRDDDRRPSRSRQNSSGGHGNAPRYAGGYNR